MKTTFLTVLILVALLASSAEAQTRCTVSNIRKLETKGIAIAPRISADGTRVLFSRAKHRGAYILDLATGKIETVLDAAQSGYRAHWNASDSVSLSVAAQRSSATGCTYVGEDDVVWQDCAGERSALSLGEDRYFSPLLSPDGRWLVYRGLNTGLYLADLAAGTSHHLGPGAKPAWSHDSKQLVFNISLDDGLSITQSDLWLFDVQHSRLVRLTATTDKLEMAPTLSGTTVVYEDRSALLSGEINCSGEN